VSALLSHRGEGGTQGGGTVAGGWPRALVDARCCQCLVLGRRTCLPSRTDTRSRDAVTRLEAEIDQRPRAERFIEMNAEVTSGRQWRLGAVRPGPSTEDQEVGSVVRVPGSSGCGECAPRGESPSSCGPPPRGFGNEAVVNSSSEPSPHRA
jgi:hypothetical protein